VLPAEALRASAAARDHMALVLRRWDPVRVAASALNYSRGTHRHSFNEGNSCMPASPRPRPPHCPPRTDGGREQGQGGRTHGPRARGERGGALDVEEVGVEGGQGGGEPSEC